MKKTIHLHYFALLFLFPILSFSQGFEWAEQVGVLNLDNAASLGWTSNDVEKDANGNLYLTGFYVGEQMFGDSSVTSEGLPGVTNSDDGFIAKYSADGTFEKVKTFPSTMLGNILDIEVDDSGNVFLLASFFGDFSIDATLIESMYDRGLIVFKLNSNWELEWFQSLNKGSAFNDIWGFHLEINSNDVFITGSFQQEIDIAGTTLMTPYMSGNTTFMASFDQMNGGLNWTNFTGIEGWEGKGDMATDDQGNIFLATTTSGNYSIGGEVIDAQDAGVFLLIKYDEDGNLVWIKRSENGSFINNHLNAIDIDKSNGDIFLTGQWSDTLRWGGMELIGGEFSFNVKNMWIAKLNDEGNFQWLRSSNNPTSLFFAQTKGLHVNANGEGGAFISGQYKLGDMSLGEGANEVIFLNIDGLGFVAKYNSSGELDWAKKLNVTGSPTDLTVKGMVAVGSNQVVFTGLFQQRFELGDVSLDAIFPSTVTQPNIYLVKIDGDLMTNSEDVFSQKNDFIVFPNPTSDYLQLKLNDEQLSKNLQIEIVDLSGALLYQSKLNEATHLINLSGLASGNYFLKIIGDDFLSIKKIIKIN